MRGIGTLILVGTIAQASTAHAEPVRYLTRHFIFASMDVPSIASQSQPDTFVAQRGGAEIEIILNASTPHDDEREVDCQGGRVTYKLDRPSVFAYSCSVGGDIVYTITKYGKTYRVGASGATEEIGYSIRYPASQRSYWDVVVTHMTRSLRFAPVRED